MSLLDLIDALNELRDALVELSQESRDLLFEFDMQGRIEAGKMTEEILNKVKY